MLAALRSLLLKASPYASQPEERVEVQLVLDGQERVQLVLNCQAVKPQRPSLTVELASSELDEVPEEIAEDDLLYKVQLQDSFSPGKAVHLVLLPTSKEASGSLTHDVSEWLSNEPEPEAQEVETPSRTLSVLKKLALKSPARGSASKAAAGAYSTDSPKSWSIGVPRF